MGTGETWTNAIIGAVITLGLSFTGVSPLLGGGVAGYLQNEQPERGAAVGAISGAIAALPAILLLALAIGVFLLSGPGPGGPGGIELVVIVVGLVPMLLAWFVGLSAGGATPVGTCGRRTGDRIRTPTGSTYSDGSTRD